MTLKRILAGALALPAFSICGVGDRQTQAAPPKAPLGLPPLSWPRDNPYSAAKVELGRTLYFDRRLSADETRELRELSRTAPSPSPTAPPSPPASSRRRADAARRR